jgi:hypothetical protein
VILILLPFETFSSSDLLIPNKIYVKLNRIWLNVDAKTFTIGMIEVLYELLGYSIKDK